MPFEIRIINKITKDPECDFGVIREPLVTLKNKYYPESISLLEIDIYNTKYLFDVKRTWILDADINKSYAYRQQLISHDHNLRLNDVFLKGVLVNEDPKKVSLYFGDNDKNGTEHYLATIPKTEEDVIEYDGKCYSCKQVIYRKGEVAIILDNNYEDSATFELKFFNQSL